MIAKTRAQLPAEYSCLQCGGTKIIDEMILVFRRRTQDFLLRPRCKDCNNKRERGHRREWKRKYLKLWRKRNPEINESYWRGWQKQHRKELTARAAARVKRHHHALLIQGRLRRRLGMRVSLKEATALCEKYGPCYPTRYGLTPAGLKECERIRATMRRTGGKKVAIVEIRMMVYEDGMYITPKRQEIPYQHAAEQLRRLWVVKRLQVISKVPGTPE